MDYKRCDGCFSRVLFQIRWQLQTQIVKNVIFRDSLLKDKLYSKQYSFFWKNKHTKILKFEILNPQNGLSLRIYESIRVPAPEISE